MSGQQSALPKCYVYYCCDCLPAMLWKLLVGWLQHKHIWNLCTHDMLEASSIRWEKNEASGPPSQGPKQRRMSADRGLTVIQPHSPGGAGSSPTVIRSMQVTGKLALILPVSSRESAHLSETREMWAMQAFLRTHSPALGR